MKYLIVIAVSLLMLSCSKEDCNCLTVYRGQKGNGKIIDTHRETHRSRNSSDCEDNEKDVSYPDIWNCINPNCLGVKTCSLD